LDIYDDELKALEANYNDAKIIENLKNGEFIAPSYLHNTIEQQIMVWATLCVPIHFEIQEEAFRPIAHSECSKLVKIGRQYKCQIEIQETVTNHICTISKAATQDHISNKLTAAAIKIHQDDLAEQKVLIL
jgi:diketogulonate reductase-like aldo/keto reductase